jgi:IS30 family transposase
VIGAGKAEISPRYLSEDDRVRIADLRRAGLGVRAIAAVLGRSPSTASRELRRNCEPRSGQYRPFAAQRLAARRRARPGRGRLNADPVLRQFVAGRLEKRWSPEQISQALRAEFPGDPVRHLVHETIYQAVYRPELGGLRRGLPALLRTGRRHRKSHRRDTPGGLGQRVRLPAGRWMGERAATDILVLARKGRASASLDTLMVRQGGKHVLYGSALALSAAIQAWAAKTDTPVRELARTAVR